MISRTMISIHKALAGLDGGIADGIQKVTEISIHKALAGLDGLIFYGIIGL